VKKNILGRARQFSRVLTESCNTEKLVEDRYLSQAVQEKEHGPETERLAAEVFSQLDGTGILYCLLREYEPATSNGGRCEIDLLVNPDDAPSFANAMTARGFVELPSWGHEPHRFFVTYDENTGAWLKLDVVTDLRYGKPIRRFRIDLMANCLQERQRRDAVYTLSPDNELITLFLHCLIDKGEFREKHRVRLTELRKLASHDATCNRRMAAHVDKYLSPTLAWQQLASAIDDDAWRDLLAQRTVVTRLFFWREPVRSTWRNLTTRLRRRMRPLFFAIHRRGLSVALLAPDGAGKSTLAYQLSRDPFLRARLIYMGTNVRANTVGLPTTAWLHHQIKKHTTNGAARTLRLLKGFAFVNRVVEQWYRSFTAMYHLVRGRFVIYDRYVYDSWLVSRTMNWRKRLRRWLLEVCCPAPDLVILLDAPGEVLYQRKGEHSPEWLEQQRQGYLKLAERLPQMSIIDARQSAEQVKRQVTSLIWRIYGAQGYTRR